LLLKNIKINVIIRVWIGNAKEIDEKMQQRHEKKLPQKAQKEAKGIKAFICL
jgi:hypothetical protein